MATSKKTMNLKSKFLAKKVNVRFLWNGQSASLPRMRVPVHIQQHRRIHLGVNLRRAETGVAEQFLQAPEVRPRAEQVRCERVAERVGGGGGGEAERGAGCPKPPGPVRSPSGPRAPPPRRARGARSGRRRRGGRLRRGPTCNRGPIAG